MLIYPIFYFCTFYVQCRNGMQLSVEMFAQNTQLQNGWFYLFMQNIFFLPQKCVVRALIFKNDVLKPENLKRFTFFVFYVFGQLLPREAEHMKLRLHIILNYYTNYRSVVQWSQRGPAGRNVCHSLRGQMRMTANCTNLNNRKRGAQFPFHRKSNLPPTNKQITYDPHTSHPPLSLQTAQSQHSQLVAPLSSSKNICRRNPDVILFRSISMKIPWHPRYGSWKISNI